MTRTEIKAASDATLDARWAELRATALHAMELSYVVGERARLELDDVERELRHRVQMEYNAANNRPCVAVPDTIGPEAPNQWCATCADEHEFPATVWRDGLAGVQKYSGGSVSDLDKSLDTMRLMLNECIELPPTPPVFALKDGDVVVIGDNSYIARETVDSQGIRATRLEPFRRVE